MGLFKKFFSNARKPVGFLGKIMVSGMNGGGHAAMANWALKQVMVSDNDHVLDIGCGGGGNIARMLKLAQHGKVDGIDFSSVSVEKSKKVNAKAIVEGRCEVMEGNVTKLTFEAETFDVVTAFETIYFWPDIEHCFNEVKRVLKIGGKFVIVNESDGTGAMDAGDSSEIGLSQQFLNSWLNRFRTDHRLETDDGIAVALVEACTGLLLNYFFLTGNSKYVSGYGSSMSVKCHHSLSMPLKP